MENDIAFFCFLSGQITKNTLVKNPGPKASIVLSCSVGISFSAIFLPIVVQFCLYAWNCIRNRAGGLDHQLNCKNWKKMRKGGSVKNMYSSMSTHNANRRRTDKSGVILKVQSLLQRCNCMEKLHNTFEAKIITLKKKGR